MANIRLALREEGMFWNAYLAQAGTMAGAKLIGSIAMGAVRRDPKIKEAFQDVMQQVVSCGIKELTGKEPVSWDISEAPEAERAGHA